MSIRPDAIRWLNEHYGRDLHRHVYTSKFFTSEESWPKKAVWWITMPVTNLIEEINDDIFFLCQVAPSSQDFYMLAVPARFLQEHLENFDIVGDTLSLYLSAEQGSLFKECRGKGNIDFTEFCVNPHL